jgi:hypothetical protein
MPGEWWKDMPEDKGAGDNEEVCPQCGLDKDTLDDICDNCRRRQLKGTSVGREDLCHTDVRQVVCESCHRLVSALHGRLIERLWYCRSCARKVTAQLRARKGAAK